MTSLNALRLSSRSSVMVQRGPVCSILMNWGMGEERSGEGWVDYPIPRDARESLTSCENRKTRKTPDCAALHPGYERCRGCHRDLVAWMEWNVIQGMLEVHNERRRVALHCIRPR